MQCAADKTNRGERDRIAAGNSNSMCRKYLRDDAVLRRRYIYGKGISAPGPLGIQGFLIAGDS
jgi:hypothetical protein